MQYLGGKSRIAKPISKILLDAKRTRTTYVEPFLGAGSVALLAAPEFERVVVADVVPDLVLLWNAAILGWVPPTELSEEDYRSLRHSEPSPLRGFAGFPCSFGGKWFGGYARDPRGGRNFAESASRSIVKRGQALRGADVRQCDYRDLRDVVGPDTVVYADPPYAGTTTYSAADPFDTPTFWNEMRSWAGSGAAVFVSEYEAPEDWVQVWEGRPQTSIARNHGGMSVVERLFTTAEIAASLA
jgi:DNA adenine methylase